MTAIFNQDDFPNMATHCDQSECGFSLFRGVLVQWDEDHDDRVLEVIDEMPCEAVDYLLIVQEHEGSIAFVWAPNACGFGEHKYKEGDNVAVPDGDSWRIVSSVTTQTTVHSLYCNGRGSGCRHAIQSPAKGRRE